MKTFLLTDYQQWLYAVQLCPSAKLNGKTICGATDRFYRGSCRHRVNNELLWYPNTNLRTDHSHRFPALRRKQNYSDRSPRDDRCYPFGAIMASLADTTMLLIVDLFGRDRSQLTARYYCSATRPTMFPPKFSCRPSGSHRHNVRAICRSANGGCGCRRSEY